MTADDTGLAPPCICCGIKPALPDKAYCEGCRDFLQGGDDMSDSGRTIGERYSPETYREPDPQPAHPKVLEMATRAVLADEKEKKSADSYQPSGDHYIKHGRTGEQHWTRMWRLFGPAWFVCNATKYTERAGDKNGLQDIEKALHYLTKLKELVTAWRDGTGPPLGNPTWGAFAPPSGVVRSVTKSPEWKPLQTCPHGVSFGHCSGCGTHIDFLKCDHPDASRVLIQTVAGSGWRCDLCGHKESN